MTTLTVGPGQEYASLTAAVAVAQDGDVIQVMAGTYIDDFPATITTNVTIEGIGGLAVFVANEPLPNEKGILVIGSAASNPTVTLDNIAFTGAEISAADGGNGAGVRYQSGTLIINDCYFYDNQEGLLANADTSGSITITDSEFADNGTTSGLTHNVYIGEVGTFSITGSYITAANTGNEIQSRALVNNITDNRIVDGPVATASYSINLPDGGVDTVSGNIIEQGPHSENAAIINFGGAAASAGGTYSDSSLTVSDNTIVNDLDVGDARAILNNSTIAVNFTDNSVWGLTAGQISSGPVTVSDTTFLASEPAISTAAPYTTLFPLCFCAGTLIATPRGDVPIERLTIGDTVLTHTSEVRPIVWIGVGQVRATRGQRNEATPVILRKGALADNVPHHDLRVTKGHAFYLEGVLIPVEFLVNHRSIIWDDRARDVSIFHLELATHDVLLANGAPAESYRDVGNRWLFQNARSSGEMPAQEPCAAVLTGGPIVDMVWRQVLERSGPRPLVPMTDDPDLHLMVNGARLDAASRSDMAYVFRLPANPAAISIASRASVPQELGIARDPRSLGVALRRIVVWRGRRPRLIEVSDPLLDEGCHSFEECNGLRWTNGDAPLPAALFDGVNGVCELELQIGCTTQYPLYGDHDQPRAAA